MSLNLASILRTSAARYPTKPAIIIGEQTLDYATLHGYVERFAGGLKSLGLQRGQHVALMLPNVPQFTIAYFACHYLGLPVVPLNVLLVGEEVAYHLEDSDAAALIAWEGFAEAAGTGFERAEQCKHLVVAKTDPADLTAPGGAHSMTALIASGEPVTEIPDTTPEDTAVILYTSGTTGRAKGAELTHFNLFYNADFCATKLMSCDVDTVSLIALPLFHSFGQTVLHNAGLWVGATLVLLPRFDPISVMGLMTQHRITVFGGVPTMYFALLNHPEADQYDLSALQTCVCGGASMPVEVMKAFDEKYDVNILEGYGLSETSPVASFNLPDRPKKVGSIGTPIPGVEFRLVAEDGTLVTQTDTPGEIEIKGHPVMKGYYERPKANAEAIVNGWFKTGDIATIDQDGYYFIVDRKKDMIIRGGFNVYPREIEEVLYAFDGVAEAAVIGVPNESHGEEVKAVIALKPGHEATAEDIIEYCKGRLGAYKYPRMVEFMDALPKGATGKILKRALKGD